MGGGCIDKKPVVNNLVETCYNTSLSCTVDADRALKTANRARPVDVVVPGCALKVVVVVVVWQYGDG